MLQALFKGAAAWKRLRHPNIVPFIGVTASPLQIISGWMSNGTLIEFIEKNSSVNRINLVSSPRQLCLVDNIILSKLLDVAKGLEYLHANNTVHGNLKGVCIFFGPI